MKRTAVLTATTALFSLAVPQFALADVNAKDVWANYVAYMKAFGAETTATLNTSGNVTSVTDFNANFALPMGLGAISVKASGFDLVENGYATVTVRYPDNSTISGGLNITGQGSGEFVMKMLGSGIEMKASGEPGDITYTYDISDYSIEFVELTLDEMARQNGDMAMFDEVKIDALFKISGNTGTFRVTEGDMLNINMSGGYSGVEYDFDFDMGDLMNMVQSGSNGKSTFTGNMVLPANGVGIFEWPQAMRDGLAVEFNSQTADTVTNQEIKMFGQVNGYSNDKMGFADVSFFFDELGLRTAGIINDYSIDTLDPEFPIPIKADIGRMDIDFAMPILGSSEPQPFVLAFGLNDLTVDESLWGLIDPAKGLPRDPATVRLATSGKMGTTIDLLDFNALMALENSNENPFSVHELTIAEIYMNAIGAELSGEGAFTFDMNNMFTFPGMPAPTGEMDFTIVGANGVIDKMVEMGLVADEEAMGARMMMGLFARPGSGEDTLTSKIEVDGATGAVSANGQRLQ